MYQLFYVERVQYCGIHVNRPIPLFIEWDDDKLKQRQEDEMISCSFWGGRVLDQVEEMMPLS